MDFYDFFDNTSFNPPHVYTISTKGNEAAVGLGNGNICIFECEDKVVGKNRWEAHEDRLMCCAWAKFNDMLITASFNDLALWNYSLVKRVSLENKVIFR